jgi:hypothetical protein
VLFSDTFQLDGGRNVAFDLRAGVDNNWLYAALDLVKEDTGQVTSFDSNIEYYHGIDDGESWDEGSRTTETVIGPVDPGGYVLRVEAMHGGLGDAKLHIRVRQGVFRWSWFGIGLAVLGIPFLLVGLHARRFRARQWENSNARSAPAGSGGNHG